MTELHVVFGASGGIGNAIIRSLIRNGRTVRGINRTGIADVPEGVEVVAADLLDIDKALGAVEGATHIYNCINVPYPRWDGEFPKITTAFIDLLRMTGARGIVVDNLYMYGEGHDEPFNEEMSYLATGKKGKIRARCSRMYEESMEQGDINAVICRAPNFYGPGVTHSSFFGDRLFPNVLAGKKVSVFGNLDAVHAIIYVDDFAEALTRLAFDPDAYGQIWHAPMDDAVTQREFIELAFKEAQTSGDIKSMPSIVLSVLGLFVPMIKEIKELMYEFNSPHEVNSSKYTRKYDAITTTHQEGIRQTLDWYRTHYSAN